MLNQLSLKERKEKIQITDVNTKKLNQDIDVVREKVHNFVSNVLIKEQKNNKSIIPTVSSEDFVNYNDFICLKALIEKPLTRDELSKKTKLARTTTYDALQRLLINQHIVQLNLKRNNRGRPIALFFAVSEIKV